MFGAVKDMLLRVVLPAVAQSSLMQRAARRVAVLERDFTGERLGVWLGAATKEVVADLTATIRKLYGGGGAVAAPRDASATMQRPVNSHRPPRAAGATRRSGQSSSYDEH